jgi:hypothetical protein
MLKDFAEELRHRQAEEQASSRKRAADRGEDAESASPTEGSREDDQVRSQGSDPDEPERDGDEDPRPIFERGGWGGGPRRTRFGSPSGDIPEFHVGRGWIILGVAALVLIVLLAVFALTVGLATDAIWFGSVGFGAVFWTRLGTQVLCFLGGFLVAFLFLWVNIWLAGRFIPKGQLRRFSLDELLDRFNVDRYMGGGSIGRGPFGNPPARTSPRSVQSVQVPDIGRPVFWGLIAIGLLIALTMGGLVESGWTTIQLFLHRVPFGQTDPTFGKDIGFYIFELPLYRLAQSYANALLLVAIALVGIRYLVAVVSGASMPTTARVHLGLLAMLYLWSVALGYQLDRYELVYSGTSGLFQGASYTDMAARVLAITVMTVLAAFAGAFILGFAYTRLRVPLILTLAVWLGAYTVLDAGYPLAVQRLQVEPNQQGLETPYIKNNIDMTRQAFGLSNWSAVAYTPGLNVTPTSLKGEDSTIQNLRLWDYRPLQPNLTNSQLIRPYYSFSDVDTDRYVFTDAETCAPNPAPCVRQVMLSGRELDPQKVLAQNNGDSSWVNQHLVFTHGIGLVMLPVNEVVISQQNQSASPKLVVQDLPPVSAAGAPVVKEPRIYFGTQPSDYVIVGGNTKEFDYQSSGSAGEVKNTWTGTTGIKLDTLLSKLLFSARLGDLNLLISNQVSGNSQLLFRRSIEERVQAIAPFLRYDKDPYLVVTSSGRLDYILDAFTTSAAYPDANLYDPSNESSSNRLDGDPFNYIRNSVKVVMDAYDGTTTFYVADPTDPIIQAWEGVFPGVFHPLSDMSSDLQAHLRYPESMYNAQTSVFGTYHVTDPSVFFSQTDVWHVMRNSGSSNKGLEQLPLEAYYVEMQVPGQSQPGSPEFLLLQPMVPKERPNMIAWVAAHNDPGSYGKVEVFNFPGTSTILGPTQIQALIAANKDASKDLSLWSTQGSTVTMGNLLVVPLQDSILYVEPVYVQSSSNPIPVLQKIALAGGGGQIVWGDPILLTALQQLTSGGAAPAPSPSPGASPGASPTPAAGPTATATATGSPTVVPSLPPNATPQQLTAEATRHYLLAQQALRNGDLATYQSEMNQVGQLLNQLGILLGTPAPAGP